MLIVSIFCSSARRRSLLACLQLVISERASAKVSLPLFYTNKLTLAKHTHTIFAIPGWLPGWLARESKCNLSFAMVVVMSLFFGVERGDKRMSTKSIQVHLRTNQPTDQHTHKHESDSLMTKKVNRVSLIESSVDF